MQDFFLNEEDALPGTTPANGLLGPGAEGDEGDELDGSFSSSLNSQMSAATPMV